MSLFISEQYILQFLDNLLEYSFNKVNVTIPEPTKGS